MPFQYLHYIEYSINSIELRAQNIKNTAFAAEVKQYASIPRKLTEKAILPSGKGLLGLYLIMCFDKILYFTNI